MQDDFEKEARNESSDAQNLSRLLLGLTLEDKPPFGRNMEGLAKMCTKLLMENLSKVDDARKEEFLAQFLLAIVEDVNEVMSHARLQGMDIASRDKNK